MSKPTTATAPTSKPSKARATITWFLAINFQFIAVWLIAKGYMGYTAYGSFHHIIDIAHELGLHGGKAKSVPFLIDGFAFLGMIMRSRRFDASSNRAGIYLMAGAGALSLVCNVLAGHNLGERLYGGLTVIGFVVAEWVSTKARPRPKAGATTKHTCRSRGAGGRYDASCARCQELAAKPKTPKAKTPKAKSTPTTRTRKPATTKTAKPKSDEPTDDQILDAGREAGINALTGDKQPATAAA